MLEFLRQKRDEWMAKHEINKQERFARREEKRQLALEKIAQEEVERAEAERLASLNVDAETGEILEDSSLGMTESSSETSINTVEIVGYNADETADEAVFDESLFDSAPTETINNGSGAPIPEMIDLDVLADGHDLEPQVDVDFTPKQHLHYKLPGIDLFAADKPKSQAKVTDISINQL